MDMMEFGIYLKRLERKKIELIILVASYMFFYFCKNGMLPIELWTKVPIL
jgi:hypothetical protein